jgi:hypothetical protein
VLLRVILMVIHSVIGRELDKPKCLRLRWPGPRRGGGHLLPDRVWRPALHAGPGRDQPDPQPEPVVGAPASTATRARLPRRPPERRKK